MCSGRDDRLGSSVLWDDQLGDALILKHESMSNLVVDVLQIELFTGVRQHADLLVRGETRHEEAVVPRFLLLHVHEVPEFDVLEELGDDRLAAASCLARSFCFFLISRAHLYNNLCSFERLIQHLSLSSSCWITAYLMHHNATACNSSFALLNNAY